MVGDITRYLQIWTAVGKDAPNLETDVGHIQVLIRLSVSGRGAPTPIDCKSGPSLVDAISAFQRDTMKIAPDGRVEPASKTFRALLDQAMPRIADATRMPAGSLHRAHLKDADFAQAAKTLGCTPEAIKAVSEVESHGAPFLRSGKPKILFEPHVFGKLTDHQYDKAFPEVSRRQQLHRGHGVHDYGSVEDQWDKLRLAAVLDRIAAVEAASWGRFQVLGINWKDTGAASLDAFLNIMFTSEKSQLDGFVTFVKHRKLDQALIHLNWRAFAYGYNGPKFHGQNYDGKIAQKYRELVHRSALARI